MPGNKGKRKAADLEDAALHHVTFSVPTVKRVQNHKNYLGTSAAPNTISKISIYSLCKQFYVHFSYAFLAGTTSEKTHPAVFVQTAWNALSKDIFEIHFIGQKSGTLNGNFLFDMTIPNFITPSNSVIMGRHDLHHLPPNKLKQLMRARLFPATTREPETAFTVTMLKDFQLHNLESKKAAYDYLGAIL
ncbi:hypothetical protein B0H13DRAFT_1930416 [Mycena leptocephala]|nr:hypothetical protein B0H13DRAFT_1930416 [Mycena leptocephala]